MAQACAICGKTKNRAWRLVKLRGKYNPTIKRDQKPNLQWMPLASGLRLAKAGYGHAKAGGRIKACTKCMKAAARAK